MIAIAGLFVAILLLNVIPAFAPPTWMAMSWIGFHQPERNPLLLAIVAAGAATTGRLLLARGATWLVRGHLMREADRQNIDVVKAWLEKRKAVTAAALLLYAFSPFPSNYLFIAYGLTNLRLWLIAVPFFFGRLASYAAWAHFAQLAHAYFDTETRLEGKYLGGYFIVTQLFLLGVVFLLTRVDWGLAVNQHRLRLRKPANRANGAD